MHKKNILKKMILIISCITCSGFHGFILYPSGEISLQQYKLIIIAFISMLFVVLPVIFMSLFFVYNYRASRRNIYSPNWTHSNKIEWIVWMVPIIIIFFLGILAWHTTYSLDPKKPIRSKNHPIIINVVALDWKWLFIYPNNHIMTINECIIPVNTPIIFNITSHSVMSSFFIPSLGSQIYAMPSMVTKLNLIANFAGIYHGISSNYNGSGFSDMKFNVVVVSKYSFDKWMLKIQHLSNTLNNMNQFNSIAKPSILCNIKYFICRDSNFFQKIVNQSI